MKTWFVPHSQIWYKLHVVLSYQQINLKSIFLRPGQDYRVVSQFHGKQLAIISSIYFLKLLWCKFFSFLFFIIFKNHNFFYMKFMMFLDVDRDKFYSVELPQALDPMANHEISMPTLESWSCGCPLVFFWFFGLG